MKSSLSSFALLALATSFLVSCSDSQPVTLREENKPPVTTPPGQTKPEPTPGDDDGGTLPAPTPNPTPGTTPSPTPIEAGSETVARIFCEPQIDAGRPFSSLRSNSGPNFVMPSITSYVNGKPATVTKSPLPLHSNGAEAFAVLRAQEDFMSSWGLYKATVDLYNSRANLQQISNYEAPSRKAQGAYDVLKLENRLLGANLKRSAYVYPNNQGTYVWENLAGRNFALPFNAETSFSPEFVGGDDYLRFDQMGSGMQTLTQKFYHFDTKKTFSLPSPAESGDSQLFGFINSQKNTILWIEGRPNGTWKLRMTVIGSGKASTLATLPGNSRSLVLPMVFLEERGDILLAYSEEDSARDSNGLLKFKTAALHVLNVSPKQGKVLSQRSFSYSQEMKDLMTTESDYALGLLRSHFYEPVSGRLFASGIPKGGLISFDFKKNTWQFHGVIGRIFSCFNPKWGIEDTRD